MTVGYNCTFYNNCTNINADSKTLFQIEYIPIITTSIVIAVIFGCLIFCTILLCSYYCTNAYKIRKNNNKITPITKSLAFIFTDIEDSTENWNRYKSIMGKAVEKHDNLMEKLIKKNSGTLIKNTGDGYFITFDDCDSAVKFTLEIQYKFHKEMEDKYVYQVQLNIT